MRANEFIMEGPLDKLDNAMQGQIIGRQQKNRANVKKRNLPEITKAIHEVLAAKVKTLVDTGNADGAIVQQLVTKVLNKMLKIDVQSAGTYRRDLSALVGAVLESPQTIIDNPAISKIINTIADKAISTHDPEYKLIDPALRKKLDVLTKNEQNKKKQYKIVITHLTKKENMQEKLARDAAEEYFQDEVHYDPSDDTESDADTNLTQFVADVFFIEGTYNTKKEGKQKVYVNRKGKWSLWRMAKKNLWEFTTSVADDTEDQAIETLIRQSELAPIPMTFTRKDDNYYQVD